MKKNTFLFIVICIVYTTVYAQDATYTINFTSNWSQTTHPHSSGSLPSNAHWSRLVGTTHNDQITFLAMGSIATPGIEDVAELGDNTIFFQEINSAIADENAYQIIDLGALSSNLGEISQSLIPVTEEYPYLTLVSMIAPSPDWMIAINGIDLLDNNGNWIEEISIDVYPYDSGTDDGVDYTSSNQDSSPAGNITSLQGQSPFSNEKMGTITITLDDLLAVSEANLEEAFSVYPNPSNGVFTFKNNQSTSQEISIYSALGQLIKTQMIPVGSTTLDVRNLGSGIFFISIETTDGKRATQKLIIR